MEIPEVEVTCILPADSELLGLGVRIGYYLAALSQIVNLKLDTEDAPGSAWVSVFTVVPIMALALKYVLQRVISNAAFIATAYIGWAQLLIMPSVLLMPTIRCFKLLVALIYAALLFTLGLLLWYWADGYQRLEVEACGSTDAFFFAKVPAYGWFRVFNMVALSLAAVAYLALLALLWSRRAVARMQPLNRPLRIGVGLLLGLVLMVLGCELTLHWNDIQDVYSLNSTGQLIAMMVGVGVVTRDAYFFWARRQACAAGLPPPPKSGATALLGGGRGGSHGGDGPVVTAADAAALAGPYQKV